MRFRPANISLINRRHYLPRLLLILSSKRQMQKPPQRFEDVDRVTPYQGYSAYTSGRFCNAAAFARRRYGSGAGVIPWNEVPRNFPWASKFQVKIASPARAQAWHPLING